MKGKTHFQNAMTRIERLNNYPGCSQKELTVRVQLWVGTFYALFHALLLTLAFWIFAPVALKVLIGYGYFLAITLTAFLIINPRIRKNYKLVSATQETILLVGTFVTILHLGGIATSGGLIVVSLAMVLSSVPLQDSRISLFLFLIFTFIVIISGLYGLFISAPAPLAEKYNAVLFMINTLSMSGLGLFLILSFIAQQRKLEQLEAEKLKELNEAKNKLFTNITHEFRTPITVIQGMTDLIEKNPEEWLEEGTAKIKNNSHILLKLVNEMLDLARIEAGVMPLHYVQGNIISHIGYVTGLFVSLAQSHRIRLDFKTMEPPVRMDFDPDKLLLIVSNLLSNALKYTPEGGKIEVSTEIEEHQTWFLIQVADSGTGIEPEYLPHVFDRFFHDGQNSRFQQGTGLGLSLVREYIELMNGKVDVQSSKGQGTVFSVRLPVTHDAIPESEDANEKQKMADRIKIELPIKIGSKTEPDESPNEAKKLPVLLIVEDSRDVSNYLAAILKNEYRIEQAENGKIGIEKALDRIPDIILSDVMMPEIDGIELLEKLKNDIRTSHIPVVLLTAKADIASRIEGLERGADAYMAKPFEEKELHIVLKNLVEIRKKLHARYASPENFPLLPENGYQIEDAFMGKVKQVLEANLDDDEFGIAQLCHELCVSHTQLYRKFKSVSNQTISEYFKALRLYKSRELLSSTTMNVTEVAFAAGFKNLSYFSREFAHQFGKSPKEFRP